MSKLGYFPPFRLCLLRRKEGRLVQKGWERKERGRKTQADSKSMTTGRRSQGDEEKRRGSSLSRGREEGAGDQIERTYAYLEGAVAVVHKAARQTASVQE